VNKIGRKTREALIAGAIVAGPVLRNNERPAGKSTPPPGLHAGLDATLRRETVGTELRTGRERQRVHPEAEKSQRRRSYNVDKSASSICSGQSRSAQVFFL